MASKITLSRLNLLRPAMAWQMTRNSLTQEAAIEYRKSQIARLQKKVTRETAEKSVITDSKTITSEKNVQRLKL